MWTALAFLLALSPAERRLHEESFDLVWKTVREQHWDMQRVGQQWEREGKARRKQLMRARSAGEMRQAMQALLDSLGQSHFRVIAVGQESTPPSAATGELGDPGLRLDLVENRATVSEVEPGSPAMQAGVRPGWVLVRVRSLAGERHPVARGPGGKEVLASLLAGPLQESVEADFESPTGEQFAVILARQEPRGRKVRFGNLPEQRVWIETIPVAPQVGRLRFNAFLDPEHLMPAIEQAVNACRHCRGFIIDLRGNPGGLAAMATGVAGWFMSERGRKLGTLRARDRSEELEVRPRLRPFLGPLAILVDSASASTAEMLAGGLQDLGRARVFGERTAGAALPSQLLRLPNGDLFQFATANYASQSGRALEGHGVTPDEVVLQTRAALAAGGDAPRDAALRWIARQ